MDQNLTKQQQYEELRKQQTQKYKEKENLKRGIQGNGTGAVNEDGEMEVMDALEQMDLDQRNDDPAMYDQFNPMANKARADLALEAQDMRMGKDTAQRLQFGDEGAEAAAYENQMNDLNDLEEIGEAQVQPSIVASIDDVGGENVKAAAKKKKKKKKKKVEEQEDLNNEMAELERLNMEAERLRLEQEEMERIRHEQELKETEDQI